MSANSNLHKAKQAKNDEFYTQLSDIEKELKNYKQHFKGKTVLCNCDDPFESNFFKYFVLNFNVLGLKKLICTCYAGSSISNKQLSLFEVTGNPESRPYKAVVTKVYDKTGDGGLDMEDIKELFKSGENELTELRGDGDFRSNECIELLKESDIVVTNPPFSLFREYVAQLMEYDKKFIVIGNMNAITYKEFFPLLKDNKVWIGYEHPKVFTRPNGKTQSFGNITWFTNLDIKKRHEKLILYKNYTPEEYPKYDNYDAINVDKVSEIPVDYDGVMGVPITFLNKYNPEQFEIVTLGSSPDLFKATKKYTDLLRYNTDGTTTKEHIACNQCLTIAYDIQPTTIYCKASNSDKYLVVPYKRLLVRRKDV